MNRLLILLCALATSPQLHAADACTDMVQAACERLPLKDMKRYHSFKFSAFDPHSYASKTYESIFLAEAEKLGLAQPIVARLESLSSPLISPKLSVTLSRVLKLLETDPQGAADLVTRLVRVVQIGREGRMSILANVNFWQNQMYLRRYQMTPHEAPFWKEIGAYHKMTTQELLAAGLTPFCKFAKPLDCKESIEEAIVIIYDVMWLDTELALAKNAEFRTKTIEAIWDPAERRRLNTMLADLKKAAASIHGPVTEEQQRRLDAVHLEYPTESSIVGFKEWATGQNGYDNRGTNNIEIFGHYAHAPEEDLIHLLAHEYGHQLIYVLGDSTLLEKQRTQEKGHDLYFDIQDVLNPKYAKVAQCLMQPNTANIDRVRLNETLAVWYEVEMIARYVELFRPHLPREKKQMYAYYLNMSCEKGDSFDGVLGSKGPAHPNWNTRSNLLLMAHPYFRELFACGKNEKLDHCALP